MKTNHLWNTATFSQIVIPAVMTMFGLELLRVLFPSLVWYLGDTLEIAYTMLGPLAIGVFLAAFLAGIFRRTLGQALALSVTVVGLGLMRWFEQQLWEPMGDLIFASVGVILFMFFIPIYLARARALGGDATRQFGIAILIGVAIDTTLHGAFGTLDLSWQQNSPLAGLIATLLVALLWMQMYYLPRKEIGGGASARNSFALATVPVFFFLTIVVLQNLARATTIIGLMPPLAFGLIALANVVGIAIAINRSRGIEIASALALIGVTLPIDFSGAIAIVFCLIGIAAAFLLIIVIMDGLRDSDRAGNGGAVIANGVGWFVFIIFIFVFYISYDIRLGIPNVILPTIAAVLIAIAALFARRTSESSTRDWTPVTIAALCVLAPIAMMVTWREPGTITGKGFPVRVMTYNIHNGFTTDGQLDLEAIARTIEQTNPDIIGFQEIARGWAIDSSVDTLAWLSQRLKMPYIFGPTADPLWGNAILSKYPIKEWGNEPLPPRDLLLKRGFLWARIDVGGGDELFLIATHYYHVEKGTEIRQQQSPVIAQYWNKRARTIFLGDLNAEPNSKEIQMLRDAGLKDSLAEFGKENTKTWPSDNLRLRLDYIWFSPDLKVSDLMIPQSTASDHLGIAVTVGK